MADRFDKFTERARKILSLAQEEAQRMLDRYQPAAVIAIERPGWNRNRVHHSGGGFGVSEFTAKIDYLFEGAKDRGIPTIGIGDLGNEIRALNSPEMGDDEMVANSGTGDPLHQRLEEPPRPGGVLDAGQDPQVAQGEELQVRLHVVCQCPPIEMHRV